LTGESKKNPSVVASECERIIVAMRSHSHASYRKIIFLHHAGAAPWEYYFKILTIKIKVARAPATAPANQERSLFQAATGVLSFFSFIYSNRDA
jgi:hypothetical protein